MYSDDGIALENGGFIYAMVNSLDQDASDKDASAGDLDAGAALIARMKASLKASGVEVEEEKAAKVTDDKQRLLESIRITFEKGQQNQDPSLRESWKWAGITVKVWDAILIIRKKLCPWSRR